MPPHLREKSRAGGLRRDAGPQLALEAPAEERDLPHERGHIRHALAGVVGVRVQRDAGSNALTPPRPEARERSSDYAACCV